MSSFTLWKCVESLCSFLSIDKSKVTPKNKDFADMRRKIYNDSTEEDLAVIANQVIKKCKNRWPSHFFLLILSFLLSLLLLWWPSMTFSNAFPSGVSLLYFPCEMLAIFYIFSIISYLWKWDEGGGVTFSKKKIVLKSTFLNCL